MVLFQPVISFWMVHRLRMVLWPLGKQCHPDILFDAPWPAQDERQWYPGQGRGTMTCLQGTPGSWVHSFPAFLGLNDTPGRWQLEKVEVTWQNIAAPPFFKHSYGELTYTEKTEWHDEPNWTHPPPPLGLTCSSTHSLMFWTKSRHLILLSIGILKYHNHT